MPECVPDAAIAGVHGRLASYALERFPFAVGIVQDAPVDLPDPTPAVSAATLLAQRTSRASFLDRLGERRAY